MKNYKKIGLALCLGACVALAGAGVSALNASAEDGTVYTVRDDFTTTRPGDAQAESVKGLGGDANDHGLVPGAWGGEVAIANESYLIYKLTATEGNVLDTVTLDINARIWNQNDGTAHEYNSIVVSAGESKSDLQTVITYKVGDADGTNFKDLATATLTEVASGKAQLYVKIEVKQSKAIGDVQDLWMVGIKLGKVAFGYTEKEGAPAPEVVTKTLTDDFTTTAPGNAKADKMVGVGGDGNMHGLVPGAWGGEVAIADSSYLVYKITSDEGNVLNSVKLDINAKIWNQNSDEGHAYNAIEVYAGTDGMEYTKVARYGQQGGDFVDLPTTDLTEVAKGNATVYVKIQILQSKAIGDVQDLWMVGIKVGKVAFTYTEAAGEVPPPAVDPDKYEKATDFGAISSMNDAGAVDYKGMAVAADSTHGAITSEKWGSPYKIATDSYVTYKLSASELGEGKIFKSLYLDMTARIWNQNNGIAHEQNGIAVYVGYRASSVTELVYNYTVLDGFANNAAELDTLDLTDWAAGYETIYVKVKLIQSTDAKCDHVLNDSDHALSGGNPCGTVATADGYINIWETGIKLYSVAFTGKTEEGEAQTPVDFKVADDYTIARVNDLGVYQVKGLCGDANVHGLVPSENWGGSVKVADESYLVYKLAAETGSAFDTLTLDLSAFLWNQADDTCHAENAIVVYVSGTAATYGAPVKTYRVTDAEDNRLNATLDISSVASGKRIVYVKIVLVQSAKGCSIHTGAAQAAGMDHIGGCGSIATADGYLELNRIGVKLYGVSFTGMYRAAAANVTVSYSDGGEIVYTDSEQAVGATLNGYVPAEKEGYTFVDWYLDEECTIVLPENYVAENDVTLYAKWQKDEPVGGSDSASDETSDVTSDVTSESASDTSVDQPSEEESEEPSVAGSAGRKGCGSEVFGAISALMLCGAAVLCLKKKRD